MEWPAMSPDMNAIEHPWDKMKRTMRRIRNTPQTLDDLRKAAVEEWNRLHHNRLNHLLDKRSVFKYLYLHITILDDSIFTRLSEGHPKLCRQTEATSMARAKGFNKERVYEFFDLLENISERYKLESTRIFNVVESGFSTVQKKTQKIVARKGKISSVGVISSGEKEVNTTMCQCI
ncbi:hypothetical protein ANN_23694 [Periplaneta americana]|uniref:Tc1-like transposase DDE domain-containing protein n=1 Tax=Periplaneta americana TaxID=6978 RepID=A0ABQ8SLS2_PERAM|nr:hypothetical protein ANN_23694 [Periplaneta americana]